MSDVSIIVVITKSKSYEILIISCVTELLAGSRMRMRMRMTRG